MSKESVETGFENISLIHFGIDVLQIALKNKLTTDFSLSEKNRGQVTKNQFLLALPFSLEERRGRRMYFSPGVIP
jgi:hypothetical protein